MAKEWTKAQLDKELRELSLGAKEAGDIDVVIMNWS